ncbi:hypothetical protein C1646_762991 [Rhizophagus diaphanus]|nr:hypothetical protein C1646_762991 [Rhizophagus diaphanus] [Rhizophagus sp. MUCL 43196]
MAEGSAGTITSENLYCARLSNIYDEITDNEDSDVGGNIDSDEWYDITFGEIFNLLIYLEDDIIAIQEELGIIGYSN